MGESHITPKQFAEAAYNLGLPLAWDADTNGNGTPDHDEVRMVPNGGMFAVTSATQDAVMRIIREAATGRHLRVVRTPEYIVGLDRRIAALTITEAPTSSALRQALVQRDMAYRSWAVHDVDFTALPVAAQKVAWILLHEVFPALEGVHFAELDPNNVRYLQDIAATGDFSDYVHAYYSGGPWCQEIRDARCTSDAYRPQRVPNAGLWPEHTTEADVGKISDKNLLSDFVIRYEANGTLQWRSINAEPAYRPYLARISAGLRHAAAVPDIEPSLKKFFEIRAREFENTSSAFPFFEGDVAWIHTTGGLDVTIGFYENYDSALGKTAIIEGYVGPVDVALEAKGKSLQKLAPLMDADIVRDLHAMGKNYPGKDYSHGLPPLRFANLVAAGDGRVKYVAGGYQLPNVAPFGDDSLYKKVFIINSSEARFADVMLPMAQLVFDPADRDMVQDDWGNFAVMHENAHGVGPVMNSKISPPFFNALEEARADQDGLASTPFALQHGALTEHTARGACLAMLAGHLRGLSYGMSDAHGMGAFIEFAEQVKLGGLVETADGHFRTQCADGTAVRAAATIGHRIDALEFDSAQSPAAATIATDAAAQWLAQSKADLPKIMREKYIPALEKMPKDIFPWYTFQFSPEVERDMVARQN